MITPRPDESDVMDYEERFTLEDHLTQNGPGPGGRQFHYFYRELLDRVFDLLKIGYQVEDVDKHVPYDAIQYIWYNVIRRYDPLVKHITKTLPSQVEVSKTDRDFATWAFVYYTLRKRLDCVSLEKDGLL